MNENAISETDLPEEGKVEKVPPGGIGCTSWILVLIGGFFMYPCLGSILLEAVGWSNNSGDAGLILLVGSVVSFPGYALMTYEVKSWRRLIPAALGALALFCITWVLFLQ